MYTLIVLKGTLMHILINLIRLRNDVIFISNVVGVVNSLLCIAIGFLIHYVDIDNILSFPLLVIAMLLFLVLQGYSGISSIFTEHFKDFFVYLETSGSYTKPKD